MGPIDPVELKKITDGLGLKICCTHLDLDKLVNNTDEVIADHQLWGCKYIGLGGPPVRYLQNADGFRDLIRDLTPAAKKLVDSGMRFMYHNHSTEFQRFGKLSGIDILFNESDPSIFDFEIDTYWVQAGGGDPAQWIRKVKDRMKVVHFKDMAVDINRKQFDIEIGDGNLNWPAILDACKYAGVEWHAVELDIRQWDDPFKALEISLTNLRNMGME